MHLVGRQLLGAGFFGQRSRFGSQLQQALLVDVLDHRDQQAVRGVHGKADVHVLLADDGLAAWRQRAVEVWQFLEQEGAGLEQQGQHGQLNASLLGHGLLRNAEGFQFGDVGGVELGHVRHVQPAAVQVGSTDLRQAGQGHFFHFTELAEVHGRDRRDAGATGCASGCRCFLGLLHHRLDVDLHVFFQDAAVRTGRGNRAQVDAEFTGQLTNRRACVNLGVATGSRSGSNRCRGSSRGSSGRCGGRSRFSLGRGSSGRCRSSSRGSTRDFQLEDQVASADFVFQLAQDFFDHAGSRRRDFHGGLVGLQGNQRLVGFDGVADLDQHFDDLGLARRTDVRHVDVLHAGGSRGCCRSWGRGGFGGRSRRSSLGRSLRGRCSGALGFQDQQLVAFFQAVAQLDLQFLDDAGFRGRDLHGGLVGLQGQQALVSLDTITDLDEQLDDFTFTAADVRYANEFAHLKILLSSPVGCACPGRYRT